jgi:glycine reductase complex component B subunit alpha and beta
MTWEVRTFAPEALAPDAGRIEDLARAEPALAGVDVAVVEPGEHVRVTHVLDAVEPRIRPDGRKAFPTEDRAGQGVTHRISDVAVLSCLDFPGEERPLHEQESIVDLAGPAADLTPFGSMRNVVLTFRPGDGSDHRAIDSAVRRVTLSAAELLAEPTLRAEPVHTHTFALGPADDSLPSVAALVQLSDLGQLYQLYLYGTPVGESGLPKLVDPAEVMDGAVTAGEYHWAAMRNPTLFFQLNSLVRTLYREHGKRLRFAGVVLMRGYEQSADDKQRAADAAAKLAVGLDVDGVVITTDGGGNSHTDTMLTCRACENAGARTSVIVCEETDLEATAPILTDWVPEADCIVSTGNVEQPAPAWKPECVLGGAHLLDGTPAAEAGPIPVRNYLGAANQMGQLDLGATSW